MKTSTEAETELAVKEAAEVLRNGGIVAIPTETVYGLACSGYSEDGIKAVFEAKGRPQDNPLILHISNVSELENICKDIPQSAYTLADAFWPGPLTMILPKKANVPYSVSAGLETVAVRCPSNKIANLIIKAAGVPLAAPSANLSGKPSTTSAEHVIHDLSGRIPLIIDGGDCVVGLESTIIDLTVTPPAILRPGKISAKEISSVIGEVSCEGLFKRKNISEHEIPKAPGMKYRHYAPNAPLTAVLGSPACSANYISAVVTEEDGVVCFDRFAHMFENAKFVVSAGSRYNLSKYAHVIFDALRKFDETDVKHIYVQCPHLQGVGMAILNRLKKASGGNITYVHKTQIIGITGTSGSGKSTAAQYLKNLGAYVIDCDEIYHRLTNSCRQMKEELCERFGSDIYSGDALNRRKLADIVFSDSHALQDLNSITHKFVMEELEKELDNAERIHTNIVVVDAPALFESGADALCDKIVALISGNNEKTRRIMQRDNISEDNALQRLSSQKSDEFFVKNADIIIENNSSEEDYFEKLHTLYTQLSEK